MKEIFYFVVLVAFIATAVYFAPNFITISQIICKSQFGPCNPLLVSRLDKLRGEKLRVSKTEIKNILTSEILVLDSLIQFKLPNILEVTMVERKPLVSLTKKGASAYAQVDKTGLVIRIDDSSSHPKLITAGRIPNVGEKVDNKNLFALDILYRVFAFYQVQQGILEENYMEIMMKNGLKVIFPLQGDGEILISSLQLILARLNKGEEGIRISEYEKILSNPNTIDLRYKNPVVR